MKPVFGLLMIFTGLTVGYLVITGKLPNQAGSTVQGHKGTATITGA